MGIDLAELLELELKIQESGVMRSDARLFRLQLLPELGKLASKLEVSKMSLSFILLQLFVFVLVGSLFLLRQSNEKPAYPKIIMPC